MRFKAAAAIVHRGQKLRDDGKLERPWPNFKKLRRSILLFIAQQELKRTLKMINDADQSSAAGRGPPHSLERKIRGRRPGRTRAHLERSHHRKAHRRIQSGLSDHRPAGRNQRAVRSRLHFAAHQGRTERSHAGRGAGDYRAGIENLLASGDAEHDFRRRRTIRPSARNWNRASSRLFILRIFRSPPSCRTW